MHSMLYMYMYLSKLPDMYAREPQAWGEGVHIGQISRAHDTTDMYSNIVGSRIIFASDFSSILYAFILKKNFKSELLVNVHLYYYAFICLYCMYVCVHVAQLPTVSINNDNIPVVTTNNRQHITLSSAPVAVTIARINE